MPLPDETKAKSAKDLIARFQSSINTTGDAPLKPRHSFGSSEAVVPTMGPRGVAGNAPRQSLDPGLLARRGSSSDGRLTPSPTPNSGTVSPAQSGITPNTGSRAPQEQHNAPVAETPAAKGVQEVSKAKEDASEEVKREEAPPAGSSKPETPIKATPARDAPSSTTRSTASASKQPASSSRTPTITTTPAKRSAAAKTATPTGNSAAKPSPSARAPRTESISTPSSSTPSSSLRKSVSARAMTPTASSLAKSRAGSVTSPPPSASASTATSASTTAAARASASPSPSTSRLMRPTASSATKARTPPLSGGGPSPASAVPTTPGRVSTTPSRARSSMSNTRPGSKTPKSPVPPLPGSSMADAQASPTRRTATSTSSAVRGGAGAGGVRESSRDTPTKIRATPNKGTPSSAGTFSQTNKAPASLPSSASPSSSVMSRLTRPTASSAAHTRDHPAGSPSFISSSPASRTSANNKVATSSPLAGGMAKTKAGVSAGPRKAGAKSSGELRAKVKMGENTAVGEESKDGEEEKLEEKEEENSNVEETKADDEQPHGNVTTDSIPQSDIIPEIPSDSVDNELTAEAEGGGEGEDPTLGYEHVQTSSSTSEGTSAPALSVTSSSTIPSEGLSSATEAGEGLETQQADQATPSPDKVDSEVHNQDFTSHSEQTNGEEEARTKEKVFNGFGPNRPYGKIGLPTNALGENAPPPLAITVSHEGTPAAAQRTAEEGDFSSKWGTREGGLPSPSGASSRAVSPSNSNQGMSDVEAGGEKKKVPIWMRKGGE